MSILRWILVLPAAIGALLASHFVAVLGQAIPTGFEKTTAFWDATDMNGQWLSGTMTIIWVTGISGAFSTWVTSRVAPSRRHIAAGIWFALLALGAVCAIVLGVIGGAADSGVGFWYRNVLELVALVGGSGVVFFDVLQDAARDSADGTSQPPQPGAA